MSRILLFALFVSTCFPLEGYSQDGDCSPPDLCFGNGNRQEVTITDSVGTASPGDTIDATVEIEAFGNATNNVTFGVLGTGRGILAVEKMATNGSGTIEITTVLPDTTEAGTGIFFRAVATTSEGTARDQYDPGGDRTVEVGRVEGGLVVTSIRPRRGAPGTQVRIYGTGFSPMAEENTVTFGGMEATIDSVSADTSALYVRVPSGPSGLTEVSVTAGGETAAAAGRFSVVTGGEASFATTDAGLTSVETSSSDWGDYDGDGDLDLVVAGENGEGTATAKIYENTSGGFQPLGAGLEGAQGRPSVAWGDYDGDGDLDLVVTGGDNTGTPMTTIYENDVSNGNGFQSRNFGVQGVLGGSADWGDFDSDGDLDLAITGFDGSGQIAEIYENDVANGNGFQSKYSLEGVQGSSADWGDFDSDGDLDLAVTGNTIPTRKTKIYENDVDDGNGFSAIGADIVDVNRGTPAWEDHDGDGDLDLLITGRDGDGNAVATVYDNTGAGPDRFNPLNAGIDGRKNSREAAAWGDYDGDGDPDLVIAGEDSSKTPTSTIYENKTEQGAGFSPLNAGLEGVFLGSASWGDYDSDGNLDLVITGRDSSDNATATIYENGGEETGGEDVLRVDASVSSPGEGETWDAAYRHLQSALAKADTTSSVSEIWIAEGTYYPDGGGSIEEGRRDTSFALQDGLEIYGGFAGGEQERSGRDPEANATVLSGNIGAKGDSLDNSYHVVNGSATNSSAVLDGAVVQGGQADGSTADANGGGLFADRGSPTIRNVTFRSNFASNGAGAALVNFGQEGTSRPPTTLASVRFLQNRAESRGGGLYVRESDVEVRRTEFRGNRALLGGGLSADAGADVDAVSTLFSGNLAGAAGGAVQTDQVGTVPETDTLSLVNATIAGNRSPRGGGLRLEGQFEINLVNSIVWNNSRDGGGQIVSGSATLRNVRSAIQGRENFSRLASGREAEAFARQADDPSVYPRFMRPVLPGRAPTAEGNFHLQKPTVLEDAGTSAQISSSEKDLDGGSRQAGEEVDLGAYEGARSTDAPDIAFPEKRVPESLIEGEVLKERSVTRNVAVRFRYGEVPSTTPSQFILYRASRQDPVFEQIAEVSTPQDLTATTEHVDSTTEAQRQYRYAVGAVTGSGPRFSRQMSSSVERLNAPLVGGTVTEEENSTPIQNALVTVENASGAEAETDRKGRYLLNGLNAGLRGYEITASAGGDSKTRELAKGLNETQKRIKIVDFELAPLTAASVEMKPALGSEERERIEVPYNGEAYYYFRVREVESKEKIEGASIKAEGLDSNGEVVCDMEGTTDEHGILQIEVKYEKCLSGDKVASKVRIKGEGKYDVSGKRSFKVSSRPNKYKKIHSVSNEVKIGWTPGAARSTVAAGSGLINKVAEEGRWKLDIANSENESGNIGDYGARVETLSHKSKTGGGRETVPFNGKLTLGKIGEVRVGPYEGSIGGSVSTGGAFRSKNVTHSFDVGEPYSLPEANVVSGLLLSDAGTVLLPAGVQSVGQAIIQQVGEEEEDVLEGSLVSDGSRLAIKSSGASGNIGIGSSIGVGLDASASFIGGVSILNKYPPISTTKMEIFSQTAASTELNASANIPGTGEQSIGSTLSSDKKVISKSVSAERSYKNSSIKNISESYSVLTNDGDETGSDGIIEKYLTGSSPEGALVRTFEESKLKIKIDRKDRIENILGRREEIKNMLEQANQFRLLAEGGAKEVTKSYDIDAEFYRSIARKGNAEEYDSLDYSVERKVVSKKSAKIGFDIVIPELGGLVSAGIGPEGEVFTKNVREEGTIKNENFYPLYSKPEVEYEEIPPLKDVISEFTTNRYEDRIRDKVSKIWNRSTEVYEKGEDLVVNWTDEREEEAEAFLKATEEEVGKIRESAQECSSSSLTGTVIECSESAADAIGGSVSTSNLPLSLGGKRVSKRPRQKVSLDKSYKSFLPNVVPETYLIPEPYGFTYEGKGFTVKIYYEDKQFEEEKIGMFRKNPSDGTWKHVDSEVIADSNLVVANVDTLTTLALGTVSPARSFSVDTSRDTLKANGSETTMVSAGPMLLQDNSPVPDTTQYTVRSALGEVVSNDVNASERGVQVRPQSGELQFEVKSKKKSGPGLVEVENLEEPFASGTDSVFFKNVSPPPSPKLKSLDRSKTTVTLRWEEVEVADLSGYRVHFDSDKPEPPYDGTATVEGRPSPVDVGKQTSTTLRGLDPDSTYYVSVTAYDNAEAESNFSAIETAVRDRPERLQINVTRSLGNGPGPQSYHLVALPGQVNRPLESTLSGEAGTEWSAFWDDGSEEDYLVEYDGSSTFNFRKGRGFWVTSKTSWTVEDSINTVPIDRVDYSASIPVHEGWNIVSNPLSAHIAWETLEKANGGDLQPIWSFDGSFSRADTFRTASSGQAYYFLNNQGLDSLEVPYQTEVSSKRANSDPELLTLSATLRDSVEASSSTVRVGIGEQASLGLGSQDLVAPPRQFETVSLRIDAPDTSQSDRSRFLMVDRRPPAEASNQSESGRVFDLSLMSQPEQGPVLIQANGLEAMEGSEVALIEPEAKQSHDLRSKDFVVVEPNERRRDLQLAIGTSAFVKDLEKQNLPAEVSLTSYPNPVGRQGTIEYTLPEQKKVTLQVYDVLGRRVATLAKGQKEAGRHQVRLDADRLASGVYFSRLQAGDDTHTQKIVVVR